MDNSFEIMGGSTSDPTWSIVNQKDCFKVIFQQTTGVGGDDSFNRNSNGDDEYYHVHQHQNQFDQKGESNQSKRQSQDMRKVLVIEKQHCKVYEKTYVAEDDEGMGESLQIYGLLGIVNITGFNFVLVITEKQYIGKLEGANIYQIKSIELLSFFTGANIQCKNYIDGLKKLILQGFYFAYNIDLTTNRQKSAKARHNQMGQTIWDTCDKRYFWNYNICQDFLYQKVDPHWIVPIIQGYVEYSSQIWDEKQIELVLISRRRHGMAGTRYNSRGLDDQGNVANFVETEQIVLYKGLIFSFVQIRGSVPLFWQQKGLQAITSLKRSEEITYQVFDKHLTEMIADYRLVIFINLLQKAKSHENLLIQTLEKMFQQCQLKSVKYTYYDFHTETKGDNFHRLDDLMTKIEDILLNKFLYFVEDRNTGKIIQEQKGVMRTNCLDCLDRTNLTQNKIAMRVLEHIISKIQGANKKIINNEHRLDGLGEHDYSGSLEYGQSYFNGRIKRNQQLFDTAKSISTTTSVTKTGKQGFMGKLDSMRRGVERFIVNNFEDDFKHECIKILLNQHPKTVPYGVKAALERHLEKYQATYISQQDFLCQIFTWNCAGISPSSTADMSDILLPQVKGKPQIVPDIFVVGLQEIVQLGAKAVIQGKDKERIMLWESVIFNSLCRRENKYVCISKKLMVGCFILLFVLDEHKHKVSNIRQCKVKTGFGGQGNKGSVAIRFNLEDTSFMFINCHLASGQKQVAERLEDLREICKKSFDSTQIYYDFMIQSHDYKFIFGDLNFRIDLPDDIVKEAIKKHNFKLLQGRDQLINAKINNSLLSKFSEGTLNFAPTYKYDPQSENYDTSQKKRIPAWCDRILYEKSDRCNGNIELLEYGRRETLFSDHRPVYGIFKLHVLKINQVQKAEMEKKLLDQLFINNKETIKNENTINKTDPESSSDGTHSVIGSSSSVNSHVLVRLDSLELQSQLVSAIEPVREKQFSLIEINIEDEYVDKTSSTTNQEMRANSHLNNIQISKLSYQTKQNSSNIGTSNNINQNGPLQHQGSNSHQSLNQNQHQHTSNAQQSPRNGQNFNNQHMAHRSNTMSTKKTQEVDEKITRLQSSNNIGYRPINHKQYSEQLSYLANVIPTQQQNQIQQQPQFLNINNNHLQESKINGNEQRKGSAPAPEVIDFFNKFKVKDTNEIPVNQNQVIQDSQYTKNYQFEGFNDHNQNLVPNSNQNLSTQPSGDSRQQRNLSSPQKLSYNQDRTYFPQTEIKQKINQDHNFGLLQHNESQSPYQMQTNYFQFQKQQQQSQQSLTLNPSTQLNQNIFNDIQLLNPPYNQSKYNSNQQPLPQQQNQIQLNSQRRGTTQNLNHNLSSQQNLIMNNNPSQPNFRDQNIQAHKNYTTMELPQDFNNMFLTNDNGNFNTDTNLHQYSNQIGFQQNDNPINVPCYNNAIQDRHYQQQQPQMASDQFSIKANYISDGTSPNQENPLRTNNQIYNQTLNNNNHDLYSTYSQPTILNGMMQYQQAQSFMQPNQYNQNSDMITQLQHHQQYQQQQQDYQFSNQLMSQNLDKNSQQQQQQHENSEDVMSYFKF